MHFIFFKSTLDGKQTQNCCQAPIQIFLCMNAAVPNIAPTTNWQEKYYSKFLPV